MFVLEVPVVSCRSCRDGRVVSATTTWYAYKKHWMGRHTPLSGTFSALSWNVGGYGVQCVRVRPLKLQVLKFIDS